MKLNKLAKGVLAASALMAAGFANAGGIATSDVTISNLYFSLYKSGSTAPTDQIAPSAPLANTFNGTSAEAVVFGYTDVADGWDISDGDTTPIYHEASIAGGNDTSQTGSHAVVDITGDITAPNSAVGDTAASTSFYGNGTSSAEAEIKNDLSVTVNEAADLYISFDYVVGLFAEITSAYPGQSATSSFVFRITVSDSSDTTVGLVELKEIIKVADSETFPKSQIKRTTQGSVSYDRSSTTPYTYSPIALNANETYSVSISQIAKTEVESVPEPGTLGIFALSLLGLVGVRKLKKA